MKYYLTSHRNFLLGGGTIITENEESRINTQINNSVIAFIPTQITVLGK